MWGRKMRVWGEIKYKGTWFLYNLFQRPNEQLATPKFKKLKNTKLLTFKSGAINSLLLFEIEKQ